MDHHSQTWVKVNAHVDERIAGIIELLNTIPHLQTVDSCQGDPGEAYVYFRLDGWRRAGEFLFEVVEPALRSVAESSVSVETVNGGTPLGKIGFRADSSQQVLSALKEALTVNGHTFACSGDSERRELHS